MHFSSRCVLHLQHALLVRNNAIKLDAKKCTQAGPMLLQCSLHPRVHGCAQGVSSPRHMVSLLPGQCRGAALEVDELADKHGGPTSADQGTTQLNRITLFSSAAQGHNDQGLEATMQMLDYSPGTHSEQYRSQHLSKAATASAAKRAGYLRLHPPGSVCARVAASLATCQD